MLELYLHIELRSRLKGSGTTSVGRLKGDLWRRLLCSLLFVFSVTAAAQSGFLSEDDSSANRNPRVVTKKIGHESADMPSLQMPVPTGAGPRKADADSNQTPNDLNAFFAIGFILNVLLIGAFGYWAVGQWRKTK